MQKGDDLAEMAVRLCDHTFISAVQTKKWSLGQQLNQDIKALGAEDKYSIESLCLAEWQNLENLLVMQSSHTLPSIHPLHEMITLRGRVQVFVDSSNAWNMTCIQ